MESLKQAALIGIGIGAAWTFIHLAPIILAAIFLYFMISFRDKNKNQETNNSNAK